MNPNTKESGTQSVFTLEKAEAMRLMPMVISLKDGGRIVYFMAEEELSKPMAICMRAFIKRM